MEFASEEEVTSRSSPPILLLHHYVGLLQIVGLLWPRKDHAVRRLRNPEVEGGRLA